MIMTRKKAPPWVVWIKYRTAGWKPVLKVTLLPNTGENSPAAWLRRFCRVYGEYARQQGYFEGENRLKVRPLGQIPKEVRDARC